MPIHEHFELTIRSDTAEGLKVQEQIVGLMESHGFSERDVFGMRLALEEALVNAIRHGNGLSPDKSVQVSCTLCDDLVRVVITDEGEGFSPGEVPDPTAIENLEKPGGRGIMLMKAFMSAIEYNESGNQLTLEKVRGDVDEVDSDA